MRCEAARANLTACIDRELGWLTDWRVRRHTACCRDCAAELASLHRLNARLVASDRLCHDGCAADEIAPSSLASPPASRRRWGPHPRPTLASLAAAVALLTIAGLALLQRERSQGIASHKAMETPLEPGGRIAL